MKPWYRKKKCWASILGALAVVLTIFLAPADVDSVQVIAAAVLEAAVAIGFVFAEAGIDKAGAKATTNAVRAGVMDFLRDAIHLNETSGTRDVGFLAKKAVDGYAKELKDGRKEAGGG